MSETNPPTLMVIGAHPDDAEFHAGGLMVRWREGGGNVHIACLTDGSAGHQHMSRTELAKRRHEEASKAAQFIGASLEIWPVADGELQPTLKLRERLIEQIRRIKPSLIVTHRTADYHPDHRATAQLVQDTAYLLQVPNIAPDTPVLESIPPILLAADHFTYPRAFRADWVIDVEAQLTQLIDMLDCHISQVYEWLPHTQNIVAPDQDRKTWLRGWYERRPARLAREHASAPVNFAEAFEVSEYGGSFEEESLRHL